MSFQQKIILMIFVLAMMTYIPATASTIEHCLRLKLNPTPPPPPNAVPGYHSAFDLSRMVCRDVFRAIGHSMRSTRKLPWHYLYALCNIFGDNEQKIERYVKDTFNPLESNKLIDGRSCVIVRKKLYPISATQLPKL